MKLKVIVLDLELSPRAKRIVAIASVALPLLVGAGAIAWASVPHTFTDGDTLTAADLNSNFAALDQARPVVTGWVSYTPTVTESGINAGITQTTHAFWRRVGDTLEVKLTTSFMSCPQSGQINWSLPDGLLPDPMKISGSEAMGTGLALGSATNGLVTPLIVTSIGSISAVSVDLAGAGSGGATCPAIGVGGFVRMFFHTPVQGWTVTTP